MIHRILYEGGSAGSSGTTTPQATPQQFVQMYSQYLPQVLSAQANAPVAATANSLANSAAGANPIYTASGAQQLQDYAPSYQASGANLSAAQAASQNALIQGAGGQAATSAANLTNTLNPALAAANQGAVAGVNAINLNGLSPGEYNATERAQNQTNTGTGNLGLTNNTNTISNAMNFGGAFNNKLGLMNTAVNTATGAGTAFNNAVNPVSVATNAGNTANNFGLSQYNSTQANPNLTTPYSFASSFGNQLAGVSSASTGTTASGSAQGGCYLTTACCQYMGLPDDCEELTILRRFRDTLVPSQLVREYYRVAPRVVERISGNDAILASIYKTVKHCVMLIKSDCYQLALQDYQKMVTQLS